MRNRSVDLHGYEPNLKIRDWHKMTDKIVKGIVWSPTLATFCQDVSPIALRYDIEEMKTKNMNHDQYMDVLVNELKEFQKDQKSNANNKDKDNKDKDNKDKSSADTQQEMTKHGLPLPSAPKKTDILIPDTVKATDHQLPGYEMHTEQPIVGSVFLYLNLMSSTVITFDDESTNKMGEVLLPERSLMRVSGEVRWGWRWGERFDREHVFSMTRRRVKPGNRTSVQIFKYAKHLVDQRKLQETVEAGAKRISETEKEEQAKKEALAAVEAKQQERKNSNNNSAVNQKQQQEEQEAEKLKARKKEKEEEEAFAHNVLKGQGLLGGDLPTAEAAFKQAAKLGTAPHQTGGATIPEKTKRMHGYAEDLGRIGVMMKKLSEAQSDSSKSLSDASIHDEINKMRSTSSVDDGFIYDMQHCTMTWEQMDERAKTYKSKLQRMTYDALHDTTIEGADDDEDTTAGEGLHEKASASVPAASKKKAFNPNPKHFAGPGLVGGSGGAEGESKSTGNNNNEPGASMTKEDLIKMREKMMTSMPGGKDSGKKYSTPNQMSGMPSFEQAQEALVRAKAKGLSQDDIASLGAGLEVEAFDPVKAAENMSKNWIGKMKPPPGSSSIPPPPSGMQ